MTRHEIILNLYDEKRGRLGRLIRMVAHITLRLNFLFSRLRNLVRELAWDLRDIGSES